MDLRRSLSAAMGFKKNPTIVYKLVRSCLIVYLVTEKICLIHSPFLSLDVLCCVSQLESKHAKS